MRTNIGPSRRKRSAKKPSQADTPAKQKGKTKGKLFGGVKGGRKKVDPSAAIRAQALKKLREEDEWFGGPDDSGPYEEETSNTSDCDEAMIVFDGREATNDELEQIAREIENDFESVDTDTASVIRRTNKFLDETQEVADMSRSSKKKKSSQLKIPAEVAKNLAALHFFSEDESRKKDAEFDVDAIIGLFRARHSWYNDSEKSFRQTARRFFGNYRYVAALMQHFSLTIEEFMKLFVSKYVDLITADVIRNDIIPCVAKCRTSKMADTHARAILSTAE